MEIDLNLKEPLEKNAERYFNEAKKARKKLQGVRKTLAQARADLEKIESAPAPVAKRPARRRSTSWYEKFRWFYSSDGLLVIGGRDATTNEIIIKKHTDPRDLVFHTDLPGSPFVLVKAEGKPIPQPTIDEAAMFCAVYSRAWKRGLGTTEVYHVTPDQVSKQAQSGEYIAKGAFMIYGTRTYHHPKLELSIGKVKGKEVLMAGPPSAVRKLCEEHVSIRQGDAKLSDLAKKVQKKLGGDIDEILRLLPQGSALA